jgi:signal transduction histidine kinase
MSGILGMAELLSLQDLGEDNNHLVSNIFQTSHRLLGLLNNMLDSARIESGKFSLEYRRFPIGAALGDVRQLIWPEASKKSLTVTGRCDQGVPEFVCGDEIRLRQVLLNLAFNAVKFTNSGEIQINCSIVETKPESITLRFEVKDTGIGIAPEDQSRLFEPFEQLGGASAGPYAGSGLGLNISRSLVELMQGKIGLDSKPGAGSTFWFEVPFDERNCLS